MSDTPTLVRSSRTPLRDVQNEISDVELRSEPDLKAASHWNRNSTNNENINPVSAPADGSVLVMKSASVCRNEEKADAITEAQRDITFRSCVCTGGEVELSEGSVMSEESVLIRALTPGDFHQTLNNTSVYEEGAETLIPNDEHEEHPYSTHPPAEVSSAMNVTQSRVDFKSESYQGEEASDITFKSFTCPGGEIQIGDESVVQNEWISEEDAVLEKPSQSYEGEGAISDEHTELPASPSRHEDHLYCQNEMETSLSASELLDSSPLTDENVVAGEGKASDHLQNACSSAAQSQLSEGERDVTLTSFSIPGPEVEIELSYRMSEMSMLMKNLTEDGNTLALTGCDVSECDGVSAVVLSPGSGHADHLYCQTEHGDLWAEDATKLSLPVPAVMSENDGSSGSQVILERSETALTDALVHPGGADGLEALNSGAESENSVFSGEVLPDESHHPLHCGENEPEKSKLLQSRYDMDHQNPSSCEENTGRDGDPVLGSPACMSDSQQPLSKADQETFSGVGESVESSHPRADVEVLAGNFRAESESVDGRSVQEQNGEVETSMAQDSALGLSGDRALSNVEALRSESLREWPCDAVSLQTQVKLWSALTLPDPSTPRNTSLSRSVLQGHTERNPESLWPEIPVSPMPPPQLNSTALLLNPTPGPPPKARGARPAGQKDTPLPDLSAVGKGPLQHQLRQMAELLILASGKIAAPSTPAPVQRCSAAVATTPTERRSACVWTTPVLHADRSANTSAQVEVVKEISVMDACTSTDSLLWSVNPSSLEPLSRSELEQKLFSTLIMVEILSQQLASAQTRGTGTGPPPSDLRDRLVQTEHTELSQTGLYRELYVSALERVRTLEEDHETLQGLHRAIQLMRTTMSSVKTGTEDALGTMMQMETVVNDDQEILSKQVNAMKTLYTRCMETIKKMEQKTRECVQERDNMRKTAEESLQERERVLRVLDQLRVHHTDQVSELQQSLGSHQELSAALSQTYPHLAELNKSYVESLTAATSLLREKLDDHAHLSAELHTAQQLLQRTKPVLQSLQQRASAAVEESRVQRAERDRAVEDRAQMESELEQAHASLQDASQQIADLNTQITIMNSEMTVLREQLNEVEDERAQLQRKSTELSATVSSTLASYTFLEQALAAETTKLQHSLHETQEATERADSLQAAMEDCEERLMKLEDALAQRDALLTELHTETEAQRLQLRQLSQVQAELSGAREMAEFLQAENELMREQLSESEGLLRSHLQGLRERNLECEDLRQTLQQLRGERDSLQEELLSTREKARSMLLDQGEQMAQATLDISLLQHRVRCLTSSTHSACTNNNTETSEPQGQEDAPPQVHPAPRQPCPSFLNSVMLAMTEELGTTPAAPADSVQLGDEDSASEGIGGRNSMFSRLPPAVPQHTNEESCSASLVELLSSLGESVSELHSATEQLKQHRDSEVQSLQKNIRGLQETLQTESERHRQEEAELRQQVGRLKTQSEKDMQVLQQKIQDEKVLKKVCSELEESMQAAQKHRAENSELKREGADLRRALQQSQVEVQALREELTRSGAQSAASTRDLDERIRLLREVEKLKASLKEVEESRSKLLERAKRHQMVHAMNQSKLERELHLLDDMIESVRKTLSSVPEVVSSCPELQKLLEFLG